ncbi:MAG TPA: ABC transporter substrate-binding protein [Nitrososphaeraceae archaeon]|nr:ABC transporter substrate-binding protein [Nitrososphaeraceae archaeon]
MPGIIYSFHVDDISDMKGTTIARKKRKTITVIPILVVTIMLLSATLTSNNSLFAFAQEQTNAQGVKTLRIGYFPNINHAQAVIGLGNGDFQRALGNNVKLETFQFNAGPSAIESLLANRIDASYIGPNPAINGYVVSDGRDVRVIAGATSGGASFVVRNDSGINTVKDLGGKKFASPQLGNTQDVALRKYLVDNGFKTIENGGNVTVTPVANADILTLFLKKELDGAWVPEPWATRLVKEANGKILMDERDLWPPEGKFVTAHIIVRPDYLKQNPDVIKKLIAAHVNETQWINDNKEQAIKEFNVQLKKLTGKELPEDVLAESLTRLEFTDDPIKSSLLKSANDAYDLGFLAKGEARPDLNGIYDLVLLNQVLTEKGLPTIEDAATIITRGNGTTTSAPLPDVVS